MSRLELWAGAAASNLRIDDQWIDEAQLTGHRDRFDDLDRLATLGARRVRFPVLWSRVVAGPRETPNWRWSDRGIGRLAELNVAPIVGLLDGSAPAHVDPIGAPFVDRFAGWAGAVVERYPGVEEWTPIHAPQAAAQRALLRRDPAAFLRAVVWSSAAIAAAMRRIRAVAPGARLVHTEALGRYSSAATLARQCEIANDLRWLGLDLLCGRVAADHPLRDRIVRAGIPARELDRLLEQPCVPDVIGIDYDIASDRFLDDELDRYSVGTWTGDGDVAWADVPALRCGEIAGHRAVLEEVWSRYRRPLAFTQSHLGGAREAQMRWLHEAWAAGEQARSAGIDVRAVTLSAAFGVVHRTTATGHYESGAYDVRAAVPRPTALAAMARALADGRDAAHPVLSSRGFWSKSSRAGNDPGKSARTIVVAGSTRLADRFAEACVRRGLAMTRMIRIDRSGEPPTVPSDAWAVIALDDAAMPARRAHPDSVPAMIALAEACDARELPFVMLSSDVVFDGAASRPYVESDAAQPVAVAGRTRRRLERRIQAVAPRALIVRVGPLLDPQDPDDALARILGALLEGSRVRLPDNEIVTPSFVPELVDAVLDLLVDGVQGIWHGTNVGALSLHRLARVAAARAGVPTESLEVGASLHPWGAEVGPGMRALASERARTMSTIETALSAYLAALPATALPVTSTISTTHATTAA